MIRGKGGRIRLLVINLFAWFKLSRLCTEVPSYDKLVGGAFLPPTYDITFDALLEYKHTSSSSLSQKSYYYLISCRKNFSISQRPSSPSTGQGKVKYSTEIPDLCV